MTKKICSLLLAFAMLFSLVACDGDSAEQSTSSAQSSTSSEASASSSEDTASESPVAVSGNYFVTDNFVDLNSSAENITSAQIDVVNVGIPGDVSDFNPWSFTGTGATQAIWGLYQMLYHHVDGEFYSALLKSFEISDDGLSMDCELYDYIHDWEGNHITTDDVIFSFEQGAEIQSDIKTLLKEIVKTGDYTFTFVFNEALKVGELTVLGINIVSQTAYENNDGMHDKPVGTGPYKLTSYTSGYMFTYEKVEDFWQTDTSELHPRDMANVNTINWYIITESSQRTIALEQGTIDICTSISSSEIDKFDGKNGYQLAGYSDNTSMNLFPNCDESSLCSDLNLRLAICYAISNQAILESVYGGNGTVLYDHLPSWAVGYNEAWEDDDNYYNYDAAVAAEYLAASDYNGETLTIICTIDENSVNTAQMVQNFLMQIGINSEVKSYESTVFNQYIKAPDEWDIMLYTRPALVYYAASMYSTFSKDRYSWGGSLNFFYDDEFEALLTACMATDSTMEDNDALRQYTIDNCYVMGLVNPTTRIVIPDWLTGVTMSTRRVIMPGASVYTD